MPVEIIDTLARKNNANFPLAQATDIRGAFIVVADTTERDGIPTACLRTGVVARIGNTSTYYQWSGSAWGSYTFGSGGTGDIKSDGSVPFAADQSMGGNQLTNVGTPSSSTDAATKGYVDTAVAGAGSSVTAGNGLTDTAGTFSVDADGGTLTVSGAGVKVSTSGISATELASDAVTTAKILNANVTTAKIADANVTTAKIADANVTDAKLASTFLKANGTVALSADWDVGNRAIDDVKAISYEGEADAGDSGTADNIDWSTSALYKSRLTGNCAYTFTGAPQPFTYVQLRCTQDTTGGRTVTLPAACVSLDGIVWQPNPAGDSPSFLTLYYDGTSYYYYGRSPDARVITESTTARTFGLADAGAYIRTTNGSATTLTVPPNGTTAFQIGSEITGIQAGAGQITFAPGAGVTINKPATRNMKTAETYSTWALKKVATNEWDLFGDLEVA
jgi:hypothetical protein